MAESAQPFDPITRGRIGVDLCHLQSGVPPARVETFGEFPGGSATDVAVAAARLGRSTVVAQGPKGVPAVHRDGTTAEVLNGLGAGDAFGSALCHGLLSGRESERTMRYANAAGVLVASRLARSSAMPSGTEVEDLLARGRADRAPAPVSG